MKAGNQKFLRDLNKKAILRLAKYQGPLSRAEMADLTGLNSTTVSSLVHEFIDEEVLEEVGEGASRGGRKPVLLRFNPDSFLVVGVEIEGDFIAASLMNLDLAIIKKIKKNLQDSPEFGVIRGVAALVEDGVVKQSVNLGWRNVPLEGLLNREIPGVPIYIDNIGKVGVLGEKYAGNGYTWLLMWAEHHVE